MASHNALGSPEQGPEASNEELHRFQNEVREVAFEAGSMEFDNAAKISGYHLWGEDLVPVSRDELYKSLPPLTGAYIRKKLPEVAEHLKLQDGHTVTFGYAMQSFSPNGENGLAYNPETVSVQIERPDGEETIIDMFTVELTRFDDGREEIIGDFTTDSDVASPEESPASDDKLTQEIGSLSLLEQLRDKEPSMKELEDLQADLEAGDLFNSAEAKRKISQEAAKDNPQITSKQIDDLLYLVQLLKPPAPEPRLHIVE